MSERETRVVLTALGVIALIFVVLALTGCAGESAPIDGPAIYDVEPQELPDGYVYRFVDREAQVVCWQFYNDGYEGESAGLSCLPLKDTALGAGR